jgi:dihydropteroate synthase
VPSLSHSLSLLLLAHPRRPLSLSPPFLKQNLEVLRGLRELRTHADYPTLVGLSRKRFLGELCEGSASGASDDAAARVWGTAAACAVAVAEGADIIRVHDVDVMVDVATVASSLRGTKYY